MPLPIGSETAALNVLVVATIVFTFLALAIVGWIFWRAAQRDRDRH